MKNRITFDTVSQLLRTILEHGSLPTILCVAAFAISVPALKTGWEPADDLRHRVKLVEPSRLPKRLLQTGLVPENSGKLPTVMRDLHTVARTAEDMEKLKGYGTLPWWTNDTLRFSNWRPLDALMHWLDYRLFPDSAPMIHLHSIAWFAAVIFLVTVLYRKLRSPAWVAGFAALLYLLDDSNYYPTMWIANRNLLISLVFAIITLLAHHKWRTDQSLPAAIIAPFCLALSLLSTEAGLATFGYLLAYAVTLDRAPHVRRYLSLVPYLAVILVWRTVYSSLGHGALGCAAFADPGRDPLRYMQLAVERVPILLMGQWGFIPAEFFLMASDSIRILMLLVSVAFLAIVFLVLLPLIRTDRSARFWFIAMLLSALPFCAVAPMSRHLLFPAMGAFALTAQLVASLRTREGWLRKPRLRAVVTYGICVVLLLIHLPAAAAARIVAPKGIVFIHDRVKRTIDIGSEPELENQDVIVVNAPGPLMYAFIPSFRVHHNQPLPRSIRMLAPGLNTLEVTRTGERALALRASNGNIFTCQQGPSLELVYMYNVGNDMLRPDGSVLYRGRKVALPRFSAQVVSVDQEGLPTEVLFEFSVSPDDPSVKWLYWDWSQYCYRPFKPPAIGEQRVLRGPFE